MSMRWKVKGLPLEHFNDAGGSIGEPFGTMQDKTGGTIILTKELSFYEGDEPGSSTLVENQQREPEHG